MGQRGFSLLELSIVLVIIGLLTGGVMVGQDLVRQAELRSIVSDLAKFETALNAFRVKFSSLPGDMRNATSYWGIVAGDGNDVTCHSATKTSAATCNGDGNGHVFQISSLPSNRYERFLFWHHLANAQLVEGSFSAVAGPAGIGDVVPGVNSPPSRVTGTGYGVTHFDTQVSGTTDWFDGTGGLMITVGSDSGIWDPYYPAFSPEEVGLIDTKMDDSLPGLGRIKAYKSAINPGCTTSDNENTSRYVLSTKTLVCSFSFRIK